MKTRRALQITVGVLSLLVVACLLVAVVAYAFLPFAPIDIYSKWSNVATNFAQGLGVVAVDWDIAELAFILPLLFFVLPVLLLFTASILLFTESSKQKQYLAGIIMALIGATIMTVFTILYAPQLVTGESPSAVAKFDWTSADTIIRFACGGLLALFVLFVGLALGLKPKREVIDVVDEATADEQADANEANEAEEVATAEEYVTADEATENEVAETEVTAEVVANETASEIAETQEQEKEEAVAQQVEPATIEYLPQTDVTVSGVVEDTYGRDNNELSAEAVAKINKLRLLLATNAITEQEYLKLVNIYLGKK